MELQWWPRFRRGIVGDTQPIAELPRDRREQAVLASAEEWLQARADARRLGLPCHRDPPKTWDTLLAVGAIARRYPRTARVLDAGGHTYSTLLPALYRYGYRELFAINLEFERPRQRGSIAYVPGDATHTSWPAGYFDAIACLSVLEHGVDERALFAESARLLRPGGILTLSTDYWPSAVETFGRVAYGVPIRVYDVVDLARLVDAAEQAGLRPTASLHDVLGARPEERAVHWRKLGLHYTFVFVTFERCS